MSGRQSRSLGGNPTSPLTVCQPGGVGQCAQLGFAMRRGREVHRQCFASVILCAGAQTECRLACASCWISRSLRLGPVVPWFVAVVAHAHYGTHFVALRVYIGMLFCEVAASQSQAPFVAATASRPSGFTKPTLCKVPPLGTVAQPSALPGRIRALRAASWLPFCCSGAVALVRRFALCSGQWPAASHLVCAPPTLWPRRCAAFGPALAARPPPRGSSAQRKILQPNSEKNAAGASRLRCSGTTPSTPH